MRSFSRLQKVLIGAGACGGAFAFYNLFSPKGSVHASWTTGYEPSPHVKWDDNWDQRAPSSLIKRKKRNVSNAADENEYNEQIELHKSTATRHLILIRHGQYNTGGKTDEERTLTELGRRQAKLAGQRLKQLNLPYTELIRSTMTRAQETGEIISKELDGVPVKDCPLLEEGSPVPPEPPVSHWRPPTHQFYRDGARIEAAFRRYFHRAEVGQEKDSFTVLVCHANVIRYFVCRALQFPAEAWLRISLNHGSISWISITPSGKVVLRQLSEVGFMPIEDISSAN